MFLNILRAKKRETKAEIQARETKLFKIREQSSTPSYQLSAWTPSLTQQPPSSPKRNTSVAWLRRRKRRLSLIRGMGVPCASLVTTLLSLPLC